MSAANTAIVGVLLAGGQSRRMFEGQGGVTAGGVQARGDKTLRTLGGQPMLAHAIDRLTPQVGRMILNANGDPARFAGFGLPVVADTVEGFAGPLAGVLAGVRWASVHAPAAAHIVSAATDTPFFPADLVARFVAAAEGKPKRIVLAASDDGTHPVFGLWPVALADDLEQALRDGTRKILAWTDRHDTVLVLFPPLRAGMRTLDPFFNANRPEELAEAEAWLEAMRA